MGYAYTQLRQHVFASFTGCQEFPVLPYQLTSLTVDKITDLASVHHTSLKQFSRFGDRLNAFPSWV